MRDLLPGRGEKALPVRESSPEARAGTSRKGGDMDYATVISAETNKRDWKPVSRYGDETSNR
jgi:hypothetical protein